MDASRLNVSTVGRSASSDPTAAQAAGRSPEVSVILPTYQRRDLVKGAVRSALRQTFTDFELIVVDDGSTDGTREMLLREPDVRVSYMWQENAGVAAARNRALELAQGQIVAFLDSDDRWLPDHLEIVVEVLRRQPQANLVTTSPRGVIGGRARPGAEWLHDPFPCLLLSTPVGCPSAIAVRRQSVVEAGGFDEALVVGEDGDLFSRMGLRGHFAMLQRRTIRKQYTAGLQSWGCRRGHYLDYFERRVRTTLEAAASDDHRPSRELAVQAEGALAFIVALKALNDGDDRTVGEALRRACHLFPMLSTVPEIVEGRLDFLPLAHDPAEHLRHLVTVARSWPDPTSDTALFLRLCAMANLVRRGHLGRAMDLLTHHPWPFMPRVLWRLLPVVARRIRRTFDARRYRARDGVDLDVRASMVGVR